MKWEKGDDEDYKVDEDIIVNDQDVETKAIPARVCLIRGDAYVSDAEWCVKFIALYVSHLWPDAIKNPLSLEATVKRVPNYIPIYLL